MKSVLNGGLQLSVLDGWWAEAYDGTNGWALPGEVDADHQAQDARDAAMLYRLLEDEIVPEFYAGDGAWVRRMRASLRTLAPTFSGHAHARRLRAQDVRLAGANLGTLVGSCGTEPHEPTSVALRPRPASASQRHSSSCSTTVTPSLSAFAVFAAPVLAPASR